MAKSKETAYRLNDSCKQDAPRSVGQKADRTLPKKNGTLGKEHEELSDQEKHWYLFSQLLRLPCDRDNFTIET